MDINSVFALGLDALLPRFFVLCGLPMAPGWGVPWPLCRECSAALRPLAGERCARCGLPLISELGLCMSCRGARGACDSTFPLFSYAGKVGELIACYKLKKRRSLAPFIAGLFASACEEAWPDRIIVPVPPRPEKTRLQGWDQVEEIARLLERRGFAVARPLERQRSDEQKSLGRGARSLNAKKAYALKPGASSPELPLLIDDVVTTGATLDACARALKEGGARSVAALVLAAD
jgi:ComF family protein